jgi:hypothetical protein
MDFVCQSFPESGGKYIASLTGSSKSALESLELQESAIQKNKTEHIF